MQRRVRALVGLWAALAGLFIPAGAPAQQEDVPERVQEARLLRQGAGIRAGVWHVETDPDAQDASSWPLVEGYFQRGLDRHLAIESTIGVWRRASSYTTSGPLGSSTAQVTSWIVPLLTSIKFYATGPEARLEPFVALGGGFAIALEEREGDTSGLFGGGSAPGLVTGFGLTGGGGAEWRLSPVFALSLRAGYQWIRFGSAVSGMDTYSGPAGSLGLAYRFQY
ncbi:MAG: hypothetical protein ACRELD_08595 [Longimicrobiales bacterium]